jgi:hypothetical protein
MHEMEKELYSAAFVEKYGEENLDENRVKHVKEASSFLQSFSDTLADKLGVLKPDYFAKEGSRKELEDQTQTTLANCLASSVTTCLFKMTYFPLADEAMPDVLAANPGARLDFVMLLDSKGVGRAHSRNPKWSNDVSLPDRYPVIFAALKDPTRPYRDLIYFEDSEKHTLVVVVPIREEGRALGFVALGRAIDSAMVEQDGKLMNADLTMINGDVVVASTLTAQADLEELRAKGRQLSSATHQAFQTDHLLVSTWPYTGNYTNNGMRAAFTRSIDQLTGFVGDSILWLVILALVGGIVGLSLLQIIVRQFMKPLEEIDAGIHQIISGNKEYYFPFTCRETIVRVLGEQLNLMMAVLLNKPLPEEEEEAQFLSENLKYQAVTEHHAAAAAQVVATPGDVFTQSADAYYKKLYQDFVAARAAIGQDTSKISYVKFVEKTAQNEAQLRLRHGKSQVRFVVQAKDNDVLLFPVFRD